MKTQFLLLRICHIVGTEIQVKTHNSGLFLLIHDICDTFLETAFV